MARSTPMAHAPSPGAPYLPTLALAGRGLGREPRAVLADVQDMGSGGITGGVEPEDTRTSTPRLRGCTPRVPGRRPRLPPAALAAPDRALVEPVASWRGYQPHRGQLTPVPPIPQ